MSTIRPRLSKSLYLSGVQCPKSLYLHTLQLNVIPLASTFQQAIFARETDVGKVATQLYSNSVRIEQDQRHHTKAVRITREAIDDPSIHAIFEAAFEYEGVKVRVDILERSERDRWNLIEVKSSTEVEDIHVHDIALQVYVVEGCGLNLADSGLLYLNKNYILKESGVDYQALFKFKSLLAEARRLRNEVQANLKAFCKVLRVDKEPDISPGAHCYKPYDCPYQDICIGTPGPYSLLKLPGGKTLSERLAPEEITDIRDIPSDIRLNSLQRRARQTIIQNDEYVGPQLRQQLENVIFPIHFVDFETFMPAIPRYSGTRVYQALACQWSDHIMDSRGGVIHKDFLHCDDSDPRGPFIESLLEVVGTGGSICVYSSYEKTQLKQIAKAFLAYKSRIDAVLNRLWDLLAIIKKSYYHPLFAGSFSIKAVLPILTDVSYAGLAIHRGDEAAAEYERMITLDETDDDREDIREALLRYCKQDTYAMLAVRKELLARC